MCIAFKRDTLIELLKNSLPDQNVQLKDSAYR